MGQKDKYYIIGPEESCIVGIYCKRILYTNLQNAMMSGSQDYVLCRPGEVPTKAEKSSSRTYRTVQLA